MSDAAQVEALFFSALEHETAAERAAFLDSACGGDVELRRQVEKMLHVHPRVGEFLRKPAVEPFAASPEQTDATDMLHTSTDGPSEDAPLDYLQPSTRPDSLGRIGHYEVLEVLGRGGFGIVLRAFDEVLQRVVAVKVLTPHLAVTSPPRRRFLREARSSAKVRHENVVQVYNVEEQPLPYLVMEFIPGETLQQRLDRTGPLDVMEVVQFGRQLAEGLAAAHAQGLIHRDIKPGNILIEAGPHPRVKITDFGLARAADDASLTQSGMVAGTPMFMSPEQALGETLDHRADLFSMGSVLYTMCCGRPPFRANNTLAILKRVAEDTPRPIPDIIPETPQWLCDIVSRLHAKRPEDRFASAQEVADLLARHLDRMLRPGIVAIPPAIPPAPVEKRSPRELPQPAPAIRPRFRARFWMAAAVLLPILLGGLGFTEATEVTNFRGTVIRLFSPEGTLVVEVEDPGVSVTIDGSDLVITGIGVKELRLKPGKHTVEASKDGKVVRRELVSVTKNGRQLVRVSQGPPTDAKEPDRRAAEYVLSLGGTVQVNDQAGEVSNATGLPQEPFRLTGIQLMDNKQASDGGLAVFEDCKHLTHVGLDRTQITDAGLAHFKNCKNLAILSLHHTQVSDTGLAHLKACKNLKELWMAGVQVTDAGLATFKDCKALTQLNLAHTTQVSGTGLAHLKGCDNLTHLWLNESQVTDAGLAHLKDLKGLTWLTLHLDEQVRDAVLAHLKDCKNLTELNLGKTKVTAAGIDALKKALPKCKIEWDGGVIEPR
jgi:eukaryotic-like serine/threonine-protein kinase